MIDFKTAAFTHIHSQNVQDIYPNIEIPVTIYTSSEKSFSKLKPMKSNSRSTVGWERLTSMAILSTEYEFAGKMSYEEITDKFVVEVLTVTMTV